MIEAHRLKGFRKGIRLNWVSFGLALALSACTNGIGVGPQSIASAKQNTQFSSLQLTNAWVTPTGGLTAIARKIGPDSQQIIGLANDTTISGDNFLWLRARSGHNAGRFALTDFSNSLEAVPSPFSKLSESNLQSHADSMGTIFWLEYAAGAQSNCILAFRRIDANRRLMPHGTDVLDVMLRNCVQGSVAEALNPIRDSQISVAAIDAAHTPPSGTRMLSPLAAPIPAP